MKPILYVVSTLARTGPTSQLLNIVRHLDRRAFAPHVLTLSPEPADSLAPRFVELSVPVRSLALSRWRGLVGARRGVTAAMAEISPALVHTQGFRSDRILASLRTPTPHVATVRNVPVLDYPATYGPIGLVMARLHVSALKARTQVVAVSGAVAESLRPQLGRRPDVIWNGVDTERFSPAPAPERVRAREALGLAQDARVFVSCGHLSRRKDPLFLISAWRERFGAAPDHILVLAGDGPLRARCEERARGAGNIRILGRVADVQPLLAAADCFVSASAAEGCPNAVLEALSAGVPVILSDIEPHRELVDAGPEAGRVFRRGDEESLLEALARPGQPDRRQTQEARRLAEQRFSAQAMSTAYQMLYRRLTGD